MRLSFPRNLCLAGCMSLAAHLLVITAASVHFGGTDPSTGTGAPLQATLTPAVAAQSDAPGPASLPPPEPEPPPPDPAEPPGDLAPAASEVPAAPDALPLSALSRLPDLLTPVPTSIWPPFPELGHRSFQLEIIVAADGKVVTITPRCEEILCPAADAYSAIVRTWEFAPGEYRNHPVPVRLRIEFELNPPSASTESAPPPTPAQPARQ